MPHPPGEPRLTGDRQSTQTSAGSPVAAAKRRREGTHNARPTGVYINQAARIVGVSPSLIRLWEVEGLVSPARTSSGYRVFSTRDIERLRYVRDLIQRDGLNAAGVRRLLASTGVSQATERPRSVGLGEKLRGLRRRKGLSLRALGELTGLSPSSISAVERGLSSPTVGSLHRLAIAFETTVPSLMGTPEPHERLVVRPHERALLFGAPGVRMENLYDVPTTLQSMLITVEPGAGSQESYAHEGEEVVYMVEGELDLTLDESTTYRLGPGDAMTFVSSRPHRWVNPGTVTASIVWVNTPPTF
jgi:DNA-binding transcriptional MerR regulator/mannose-6-phosphate isomerase-like protein (cupin superfamily)